VKLSKPPLREFLDRESSGGVLILIFAALGLLVANSPFSDNYFSLLSVDFQIGSGDLAINLTVQKFINYVLMTFFFFVVGLEIKRELTSGHLASVKKALMPFIAALGGIALPAVIYLAIAGGVESGGWGVPVATDIALAVGLLTLIGSKVPESLKIYLLALAVIDDIGAILIIAFVYSDGVNFKWLSAGLAVVAVIYLMGKLNIKATVVYVVIGVVLWYTLYKTGVHPTLTGVILGLMTPKIKKVEDKTETVIEWLEDRFHPLSTFFVVPLFAFANTGVIFNLDSLTQASKSLVAWGIFFGLVIGKPVGILFSTLLAGKLKIAEIPTGASKSMITATGSAAGIGFTVAIFIAHIAFDNRQTEEIAIIAVIVASVVSALLSWVMFRAFSKKKEMKVAR
jgi:NhaA family Na+:H+ antiporter